MSLEDRELFLNTDGSDPTSQITVVLDSKAYPPVVTLPGSLEIAPAPPTTEWSRAHAAPRLFPHGGAPTQMYINFILDKATVEGVDANSYPPVTEIEEKGVYFYLMGSPDATLAINNWMTLSRTTMCSFYVLPFTVFVAGMSWSFPIPQTVYYYDYNTGTNGPVRFISGVFALVDPDHGDVKYTLEGNIYASPTPASVNNLPFLLYEPRP